MIMAAFHTTTAPAVINVNTKEWTDNEVMCVIFLIVMSVLIFILFGAFGIMTYCRVRKGESLHKILCE